MSTLPRLARRLGAFVAVAVLLGLAAAGCDSSSSAPRSSTTTAAAASGSQPAVVRAACAGTLVRSPSGRLESAEMDETSGLVVSTKNPGTLWANNDSGDSARVFAISRTGALRGIFALSDATAIDWEDLAIGPGPDAHTPYLYLGDIGDNAQAQANVVVYRTPEPHVSGSGATHTLSDVDALTFTYPDGPHDAEALMVDPRSGAMFVIIKQLTGGDAAVYRAPPGLRDGSTTRLTRVGQVALPRAPLASAVTAADISTDGLVIGVRTYGGVRLWARRAGQSVPEALATSPCQGPIPVERQGEALALQPDDRGYFTVSEGANARLHHFSVPKRPRHPRD